MTIMRPIGVVKTVLAGHVSPETAYTVEARSAAGAPYRIRYWVETGGRGRCKGFQRFVHQSTDPAVEGAEVWRKPHPRSFYSNVLVIMYVDHADRVKHTAVGVWGPTSEQHHRLTLMGVVGKLDSSQHALYHSLLAISQRSNRNGWASFEDKVSVLTALLRMGRTPAVTDEYWTDPEGHKHFLNHNGAVYLAVARSRAHAAKPG